jgi:hypothetical protein
MRHPELWMPRRANLPVYFTNLIVENVRSFAQRQELNLVNPDGRPAGWTLIVGENGVGKTTLLQCLARMRPVFNEKSKDDKGPAPNPVEPELASEEDNEVLRGLARSGSDAPVRLNASLVTGVPLEGTATARPSAIETSLAIARSKGRITKVDSGGNSKRRVKEPLVLGYGAGRHMGPASVDKVAATYPTESLFNTAAELYDAENLLYRLNYRVLDKRLGAKERLDAVKRALAEILPDVERPEDIRILGPRVPGSRHDETGVQVKTPYGDVPFGQLGLGYQTVIGWTVDIAWRLLERSPESLNPLHEPAIVIVDEIDLHLHPRWQREIRAHLTRHFPNVQFITTAHSPLMAQSSLDANLAILRRSDDHAEIVNDPIVIRDWRLDQVITSELFGFDTARPAQIEEKLKRRIALAQKPKLSPKERAELDELNRMVHELPTAEKPDDQSAMDIIRRAAALLEAPSQAP